MRHLGWHALAAGLIGSWLAASAAQAAPALDRTDLLDVEGKAMEADQLEPPLTRNEATITVAPDGPVVAGGTIESQVDGHTVLIQWSLFEFDRLKRSSKRLDLFQGHQVGFSGSIDGTLIPPDTEQGCKARIGVQGSGSTIEKGSWRVDCGKGSLGLSSQDIKALQVALGKKIVTQSGIHITGRCTGSDCNFAVAP